MNSMYTDEDITEHYPEFSKAILVCLPKKATTTTKDGQSAYHSDSTRPLTISNTFRFFLSLVSHGFSSTHNKR